MKIRPAIADDIPFMMALEHMCASAAHWTEQQYLQLFRRGAKEPERLVLVTDLAMEEALKPNSDHASTTDTHLHGFLVARRIVSEWELENIIVASAARRKGLGKRFLETLLSTAKQSNGEAVFLEVRESNLAARSLYERMGFQQTGTRNSYYSNPSEDAILYRSDLLRR